MPHKWKKQKTDPNIRDIYRCDNCNQEVFMPKKPHPLMPVLVKKDGLSASKWQFCEDIVLDEVHQT